MDKYKRKIVAANGEDDWLQARDVLVSCFQKYPLYQYMEPDDSKRPEFLRRYMEANYDVAVRQGNGFLIVMKIEAEGDLNEEKSEKIVGALLFVVPAEDGIGWAVKDDTPYWEAYERYKISDVSDGGLRRLKEYEAWEHKNVTRKLWRANMPLWNALFCALDPIYCPKGCGTLSYEETIRLMCRQRPKKHKKSSNTSPQAPITHDTSDPSFLEKLKSFTGSFSLQNPQPTAENGDNNLNSNEKTSSTPTYMRLLHGLSMLHRRRVPCPYGTDENSNKHCGSQPSASTCKRPEPNKANSVPLKRLQARGVHVVQSVTDENQGCTEELQQGRTEISLPNEIFERADVLNSGTPPLITAISHSRLSAHFHAKNGFQQVAEIPYSSEEADESPFSVHVLVMDPFHTGEIDKLKNALVEQPDQVQHTMQNRAPILSHVAPPMPNGVVGCPT